MQSVLEPYKYLEAVSDHKIENKKLCMLIDTVAIIGNGLPSLVCSSSLRTACVQSYNFAQRSNMPWPGDYKKN